MSVSVEKLEHSMAKLTIEVSAETFEQAIERTYQKQKNNISVPGFRKGKVPRKLIEKTYGVGVFYEDAANDVINSTYPQEAEDCGEDIVSQPKISVTQIEAGKPFIYTAEVALKPPVSLGKYKGIEVEKHDVSVSDEEVEAELKKEQEKNAKYSDVTDRAVKDGDMITLDFEGFVDGEAFQGGRGDSYPLTIGSHSFIPGFEEQLVGAEIGVEKDINVKFPEDYQAEELKGKDATFKCTVKSIREKTLPELNDEFADDVSEFETLDAYKEDIKSKLGAKKEEDAKNAKENAVIDAIIADASMELPEPMVEAQQNQMIDEFAQRMQMQGLSIDQYFQYTGSTREKMAEEIKPQAVKRIKSRLVLEQIVKEENIEPTEEDFDAEIQKMADSYKMEADKLKSFFDEKSKAQLMQDVAVQKAVALVTDAAKEK